MQACASCAEGIHVCSGFASYNVRCGCQRCRRLHALLTHYDATIEDKRDKRYWEIVGGKPKSPKSIWNNERHQWRMQTVSQLMRFKEKYPNSAFKFYYIRDAVKRPIITVCVLQVKLADSVFYYRGFGLCHYKDIPLKWRGCFTASERAILAFDKQVTCEVPITFNTTKVLDCMDTTPLYIRCTESFQLMARTIEARVNLTEFEQKLFSKPKPKVETQPSM